MGDIRFNETDILDKLRLEVIPDKLRAVNALFIAMAFKAIFATDDETIVSYYINRKKKLDTPLSYLMGSIVTSGLITARSLLQFMGLSYDCKNNSLIIKEVTPEFFDGVDISKYKLPYVLISSLKPDEIEVYKSVLMITNKNIAHITQKSFINKLPANVYMAGKYLPDLYLRNFYSQFPDDTPDLNIFELKVGKDTYIID